PCSSDHSSRISFSSFSSDASSPTKIYTLSLHDALPISLSKVISLESNAIYYRRIRENSISRKEGTFDFLVFQRLEILEILDQIQIGRSTRLNSSHVSISYAVFCLKKKNTQRHTCT